MPRSNRRFVTTSVLLLSSFLVPSKGTRAQSPATPQTPPEIFLWARPSKQLLSRGEPAVFVFSLYNASEQPAFVSNLQRDVFMRLEVIGPDGKAVPRRG